MSGIQAGDGIEREGPLPGATPGAGGFARRRPRLLAGIALALLTAVAYAPSLDNGFVWDDDVYIERNDTLRSNVGLMRIWLELGAIPHQYFPMVHTSFWVEYQLWQLDPRGYHVVNLLLQIANALLLWRLLRALEVPGAWLAATIFAVHPVMVESVAWVTERKNVLSTLFYFASALIWLRWAGLDACTTPASRRSLRVYALSLGLFVLALLSKTATCSLPAVLLLVLWWKRKGWTPSEGLAVAPFFVLGAAASYLSWLMETTFVGAAGREWQLTALDRVLLAGRALWFYAGKLVWPQSLSFVYPRWEIAVADPIAWLYPAAVVLVIALLWAWQGRLGRGPLMAVLCYAGTLLPTLGFFDFFFMRYSFVQDHFQYLASPFLIALLVAASLRGLQRLGPRALRAAPLAAGILLAVLSVLTWRQTHQFESAEVLWLSTLEKNPQAWMAHHQLGSLLVRQERYGEAIARFEQVLAVNPNVAEAHRNLGTLFAQQGRLREAEGHLRAALRIEPNYAAAHLALAEILFRLGREDEARVHDSQGRALLDPRAKSNPPNPTR